jgi:hypothetical protein
METPQVETMPDKDAGIEISKRLVYTLSLLLVTSVAINGIVLALMMRQESLVIKESLQTAASSLDAKMENTASNVQKTRADVLSSIKTNADETFSRFEKSREDILTCLAKDASPAGNSAEVNKKQAAAGQRALDLGGKALEAEEFDKALLYFINGVNHDPGRLQLIQSVADAAMKSQNADLAERAIGVLELATMQVAADDMTTVLDLVAKLRAKFIPVALPTLSPEDAVARVEELWVTYNPDAIWADNGKLAEGLSALEYFEQSVDMSRTDGNDTRFSAVLTRSDTLAKNLRYVQSYLPLYQHVVSCLEQLKVIAGTSVPDVAHYSSVSASAQGSLAQLWGGSQALPTEMREKLNSIPGQLQDTQEMVQIKLSTPASC